MVEKAFKVIDKEGIHASQAFLLAQTANKFHAKVNLEYNEKMVDLKSEMGILSLGIQYNSGITIIAEGSDERSAMESVVKTLESASVAM